MKKADFEKLQAHIFDKGNPWKDIWENKADKKARPNRLPYFSGWAIYGDDELKHKENIKDIGDDVIESLKNNIVFVGLNFSQPLWSSWGYWQNIYNAPNLKWLFGEKNFKDDYKGAYMTDILKNIIEPKAANVMKKTEPENIKKNIDWFFEEIDILGSDRIEMYLFGNAVRDLFKKYVIRPDDEKFKKFRKKVKKCQHIYHYSRANPRFIKNAPDELGLSAIPVPVPEKRILWND